MFAFQDRDLLAESEDFEGHIRPCADEHNAAMNASSRSNTNDRCNTATPLFRLKPSCGFVRLRLLATHRQGFNRRSMVVALASERQSIGDRDLDDVVTA